MKLSTLFLVILIIGPYRLLFFTQANDQKSDLPRKLDEKTAKLNQLKEILTKITQEKQWKMTDNDKEGFFVSAVFGEKEESFGKVSLTNAISSETQADKYFITLSNLFENTKNENKSLNHFYYRTSFSDNEEKASEFIAKALSSFKEELGKIKGRNFIEETKKVFIRVLSQPEFAKFETTETTESKGKFYLNVFNKESNSILTQVFFSKEKNDEIRVDFMGKEHNNMLLIPVKSINRSDSYFAREITEWMNFQTEKMKIAEVVEFIKETVAGKCGDSIEVKEEKSADGSSFLIHLKGKGEEPKNCLVSNFDFVVIEVLTLSSLVYFGAISPDVREEFMIPNYSNSFKIGFLNVFELLWSDLESKKKNFLKATDENKNLKIESLEQMIIKGLDEKPSNMIKKPLTTEELVNLSPKKAICRFKLYFADHSCVVYVCEKDDFWDIDFIKKVKSKEKSVKAPDEELQMNVIIPISEGESHADEFVEKIQEFIKGE